MDRKGSKTAPRGEARRRKRKFSRNRHASESENLSTNFQKLKSSQSEKLSIDVTVSYVILNFYMIFTQLQYLVKSKECKRNGETYKHPPALHEDIQKATKPIYEALIEEKLLERRLGGCTQNNNESFNSALWLLALEHNFNGNSVVELAAYCVLSKFNEGYKTIFEIMQHADITLGPIADTFARVFDWSHIDKAEGVIASGSAQKLRGR